MTFLLLMLGQEGLDVRKIGAKEEDKKVKYQPWPEKSIKNWLEAFSILSAVTMETFPELGPGLMQYSSTIHKEALKWGAGGLAG